MESLSAELWFQILSYLFPQEIVLFSQTCSWAYRICLDSDLWKVFLKRFLPVEDLDLLSLSAQRMHWKNRYQKICQYRLSETLRNPFIKLEGRFKAVCEENSEATYCVVLTENGFSKKGNYSFGVRFERQNYLKEERRSSSSSSLSSSPPSSSSQLKERYFCALGVCMKNVSLSSGENTLAKSLNACVLSVHDKRIISSKGMRVLRTELNIQSDSMWVELKVPGGGFQTTMVHFYKRSGNSAIKESLGYSRTPLYTPSEEFPLHFCLILWPGITATLLDNSTV